MHDLDQIMHKAYLWDVQRQANRFAKTRGLGAGRRRAPRWRSPGVAVLIALVGLAIAGAARAAPEVVGARMAFEPQAIRATVAELESWLDANTDLPRGEAPPARIALIEAGAAVPHDGRMTRVGDTVRGLYDERSATIYLIRPWFGDTATDRGTLLHELVHHRQVEAQHWYCGRAMEWDAYRIQEAYLRDHGETAGFNWAWVALLSSCAPRDHHPE